MTFALVPDDKWTPEPGGPGVPDERADLHGLGSCDHPNYRQSEGAEGCPLCGGGEVIAFSASLSRPWLLVLWDALPQAAALPSPFTCASVQRGHFILLDLNVACRGGLPTSRSQTSTPIPILIPAVFTKSRAQ